MAQAVEVVISFMLLVLGLSYALQPALWVRLSKDAIETPHKFFPLMLFILVLGLVVVATHNLWVMGLPVVITVLGWLMAIKATVFLIVPVLMRKFGSWPDSFMLSYIRIGGIVYAILGAFMAYRFLAI